MIITFCGHSTITDSADVEAWLIRTIEPFLYKGVTHFYLGGYGAFDNLCKRVLLSYRHQFPAIQLILVVPYLNHHMLTDGYHGTIYPELESTPPRFAITKRNQWMVNQSDLLIAYVTHGWGGAEKTLAYAIRKKKNIIVFPNIIP